MTLSAVINPVVTLNLLFPLQRVVCPQSRQAAKYRIVTHNFTNDNLTNGKSPSHQSLVNIPPAPLTAPPRHRRDHGTRNPDSLLRDRLSRRTCPVSPSAQKTMLSQRENFHILDPNEKSASVTEPSHFSPPSTDHSEGGHTESISPQGERIKAGGNYIPPQRP